MNPTLELLQKMERQLDVFIVANYDTIPDDTLDELLDMRDELLLRINKHQMRQQFHKYIDVVANVKFIEGRMSYIWCWYE